MLAAIGLGFANGVFVMDGPDVVGVRPGFLGWGVVGMACLAALVLVGAALVQFVAWILAVLNAARLPDKAWLVVLLVTGLLSFGFIGMVLYLVAAPDSSPPHRGQEHRASPVPAGPKGRTITHRPRRRRHCRRRDGRAECRHRRAGLGR